MKKVFYNIGIFILRMLLLPVVVVCIVWIFLTDKNPSGIDSAEEKWNRMKREKLKNLQNNNQ
jgi:hypothetical protein